jgi:hypothetical protein
MGPLWKTGDVTQWFESCIVDCLSYKIDGDCGAENSNIKGIKSRGRDGHSRTTKPDGNWNPVITDSLAYLRHTVLSDLDRVQVAMPKNVRDIIGDSVRIYDPIPPDMFSEKRSVLDGCSIQ